MPLDGKMPTAKSPDRKNGSAATNSTSTPPTMTGRPARWRRYSPSPRLRGGFRIIQSQQGWI